MSQPAFAFSASPAPEMPEPDGLSDEQLDALSTLLYSQAEGPEADRARSWTAERAW